MGLNSNSGGYSPGIPPAGPWSLATAPANPDPANDEFNEVGTLGTIPSGWSLYTAGAASTNALNVLSSPTGTTGDIWRCDLNGSRPNWFMWQTANGANRGIVKTLTFDTNDVFVTRIMGTANIPSGYAGGINFNVYGSGYFIGLSINVSSGNYVLDSVESAYYNGSYHAIETSSLNPSLGNVIPEYLCIMKQGTNYTMFVSQGNSNWIQWGATQSLSFTPLGIAIYGCGFGGYSSAGPGIIVGTDFFRIFRNSTSLP